MKLKRSLRQGLQSCTGHVLRGVLPLALGALAVFAVTASLSCGPSAVGFAAVFFSLLLPLFRFCRCCYSVVVGSVVGGGVLVCCCYLDIVVGGFVVAAIVWFLMALRYCFSFVTVV